MVTQILCAIDDTEHSERAADFAIDLARKLSAKLIFYMVNPAVLPGPLGPPVYLWTDDYIKGYLDEALRRAVAAGLQGVRCMTNRADSIAEAIVACADLYQADLIIVGACGERHLIDSLRRTVSRIIADTANCPVLIVRQLRG
jgi:nucleotide-binding universal stress UspA family protein